MRENKYLKAEIRNSWNLQNRNRDELSCNEQMSREQDLLQTNNLGKKAKLTAPVSGTDIIEGPKSGLTRFLFNKGSLDPDPLFYKYCLC